MNLEIQCACCVLLAMCTAKHMRIKDEYNSHNHIINCFTKYFMFNVFLYCFIFESSLQYIISMNNLKLFMQ